MIRLRSGPLSLDEAFSAVRRPDCGAICVFAGTARNHHHGKTVTRLSYSAYEEMAERELERLVEETRWRWNLGEIYAAHRTGDVPIGEMSVLVAVSAPHRAEAFEACRFLIERLKKVVPIWKEEFYESGKAWISNE